jgi:hypothetical protein
MHVRPLFESKPPDKKQNGSKIQEVRYHNKLKQRGITINFSECFRNKSSF